MFDPSKPAANSPNSSAEMRGQLNSLKALIDAVPGVSSAMIGTVSTLPPGSNATADLQIVSGVLVLNLGVPQGMQGDPGATGQPGEVTQNDLNNAVTSVTNASSANSNSVNTLSQSADGSYNQTQMQDVLPIRGHSRSRQVLTPRSLRARRGCAWFSPRLSARPSCRSRAERAGWRCR